MSDGDSDHDSTHTKLVHIEWPVVVTQDGGPRVHRELSLMVEVDEWTTREDVLRYVAEAIEKLVEERKR